MGLLNVDGYYNSLLSFIDKAVDEGFITQSARHIIVSAHTAHELMSKLEVCVCFPIYIYIYVIYLEMTLFVSILIELWGCFVQDYVPIYDEAVSKLSWEMEQHFEYATKSDIANAS